MMVASGEPILDLVNHEDYTIALTSEKLIGFDKRN